MSYITHFIDDYQSILAFLSNIFGIAGFLFGLWRYMRERRLQAELKDRQSELKETLEHLHRIRIYTSGLNNHSAAV